MIDFLIGISLGTVVGWKICELFMLSAFTQLMRRLGIKDQQLRELHPDIFPDTAADALKQQRIQIRLEQHMNTLYAYRSDTEQFLAQAPDQESLFQIIQQRFPGEQFVIRGADAELLQKSHT